MKLMQQEEQEEKIITTPEEKNKVENNQIKSFKELIELCEEKKELKIKYELENNVNIVSFNNNRIEISFNDNLDKEFVKNLSAKLFEWTNQRWIISFTKNKGEPSKKQLKQLLKTQTIVESKKTDIYKKVKEKFYDAELIDINNIVDEK